MTPKEFRRIREHLGLTQPELAEMLGFSSYLSITHYESGFRTPGILVESLMRIFDEWPEKKSRELGDELLAQTRKIKKQKRKGS